MLQIQGPGGLEEADGGCNQVSLPLSPSISAISDLDMDIPANTSIVSSRTAGTGMDQAAPRSKLRMELPMIIQGLTFASRPDSGSEENIMAINLVSQLGIDVDSALEHQREFRLGNGKAIKAVGRVTVDCAFAVDPHVQLSCIFYIFHSLIVPLIMGMSFLDETETLSKYRHRLRPSLSILRLNLQLCSINNPRRRLRCFIKGHSTLANADTGSDINLISLDYARSNHHRISAVSHHWKIQFADGEVSQLEGKVTLSTRLGHSGVPEVSVDFYVLKGLTCDILLGEDFLNDNDAFRTYKRAFETADCDDLTEINTIIWFSSIERVLARFGLRSDRSTSDLGSSTSKKGTIPLHARVRF